VESYSLRHLPNEVLKRELFVVAGRESGATAIVIAHIGEFDSRELYLPAGYPSMYQYCVQELKFSEDEAYKRIEVARVAMRFPEIFPALAERRLHMTAVLKLAPHLNEANAATLLLEVEHKTKPQLEQLLATRFPRPGFPTLIQPLVSATQLAPERVGLPESAAQPASSASSVPAAPAPTYPRITPLAPERFAMRVTISQQTREKMRRAQDPLGHAVPSGDRDVVPWLRSLGCRADEARRGADACAHLPEASLEERVRVALSSLKPRRSTKIAAVHSARDAAAAG
jgi:hypothetical protein